MIEKIAPLLPFIPVAGLIFQAGRQSERLDDLFSKTYALEQDHKGIRDLLYDVHGKVCAMEHELQTIAKKL
jgi:hypothetical protein